MKNLTPQEVLLAESLRDSMQAISRAQQLLGFALDPRWKPLLVRGGLQFSVGATGLVSVMTREFAFRGRALVVHGASQYFRLLDICVGRLSQLSGTGPEGHSCEQFAYDNPPRVFDFDHCVQVGQEVCFTVRNDGPHAAFFEATIWAEPLP